MLIKILIYQQILMGVFPLRQAYFSYILSISWMQDWWVSSISVWVTPSFPTSLLMPLPMITWSSSQGGSRMPVHLFQNSTAGILSLLRKSLNLRKGWNMEQPLCSFIIITGQMVQPCSKAYLMKPFLLFIQRRISSGVVRVASSQPPGTNPRFLPSRISCFRFLWLTACTPHNFSMAPVSGKLRAKRLPSPIIPAKGPSLTEFMSMRRLSPMTLWGCTPKMQRSCCVMSSSQMISYLSKYLKGRMYLLTRSMNV